MTTTITYSRNTTLSFYGFKIKAGDIKQSLSKLTDLSGALYSFSIRVIKNERPRNKMIIDLEMKEGFDPQKYDPQSCLYEFLSHMKKFQKSFREFLRVIPAESFPELYLHSFRNIKLYTTVYRIKGNYFF